MTNKTNNYWEEIDKEFDEKFKDTISESPYHSIKSFICSTLISTINKIGLEGYGLGTKKFKHIATINDCERPEEYTWFIRSQAKAEIDKQKQDLIKSINKD